MKILAFDTATQQCSVALFNKGAIQAISQTAVNQHAEILLPLIDNLLAEAGISLSQLDLIAFSRGPGSFTGLRIGASLAQGLACAYDLPVAPISTLQSLAQDAYHRLGATHVASAMDARMQQLYWGTYTLNTAGIMTLIGVESVIDPRQATLAHPGWAGVGTAWSVYATTLASLRAQLVAVDDEALPQAATLIPLAQYLHAQNLTVPAEQALPIYLRDKVC